ncbi:tRNA glutamyl-Q(34) synthetase GluQRS [Sediminicoccus sp. KRV36]|uniref:tRNA glutamyl-Q(34) synthetase GluQRS n=1 Tax=Sediminicoccus sp. KRV36 TaxID=3133721 RepID=UPI00201063E0|nr:tRNA glutamyl-Q(34) synthetase GluQRS [Sediminicoccus rosea]UPY39191.1 tRNA glutamyl-Q(34) synthetase GluQRS [Sediminicoccus rosea]
MLPVSPSGLPPGCTTRFAPSPTGLLHLGHAHAALFAAIAAEQSGGRFLLRIEDIDATRCRPEFTAAILEDLGWLGLRWAGEPRVQSACMPHYRATLAALQRRGLLYPCFCTRSDIAAAIAASHGTAAIYPGTCRNLPHAQAQARIAGGQPYALRLNTARALTETGPLAFTDLIHGPRRCTPEAQGDVVLARRDIPASYHLCVTQDDAEQGVSLVTRGEDLLEATDIHRLLQALMGWPAPLYAHHGLITDEQGRRLAKRDQAPTLRAMRASGMSAAEVRAAAGFP